MIKKDKKDSLFNKKKRYDPDKGDFRANLYLTPSPLISVTSKTRGDTRAVKYKDIHR